MPSSSSSILAKSTVPGRKPPRAVLFDAYGTLFDVYSVAQLAEELFPGHGQALSVLWRDKQIEYTRLVTTSNHGAHYQPFSVLTRAALIYAIKKLVVGPGATLPQDDFLLDHEPAIEMLLAQYQHLDAFPENLAVLQQLKRQGIPVGLLSNGDAAMLQAAVHSAGFDGLLDHIISVDPIRKFKTHPDAYALGEQVTGLAARDILFVSCNAWDALGATWYGYTTLWVNRYQLPFEELGTQATRTGVDLRAVLDFFS
ncbi:haloacid dehalogenase type II [Rhodoferax sp.]|uniref:haloacid dehalogenase type II n=1 Tax=Rhodoferax sp. TaxID=50421 RepID=UPI002728CCC1|nr:haloacid dehalogenase type II [Rhodoferax sp.]MDO9143590.1 haloacid dehalogenase type II [Rhodoferax sp.]MDP3866244.1 haloacid dehalogenase type II [Rhodoferax sp.]